MTPLEQRFIEAIRLKQPLVFKYNGSDRNTCPYLLGKTAVDRVVVHALQEIIPADPWQWRFFYLDTIETMPAFTGGEWQAYDNRAVVKSERVTGVPPTPKFITEVIARVEI